MLTHNLTTAFSLEHGRVRVRTVPAEYTGTWVERPCLEQGARRTNDTNANGDCPVRETSGYRGRLILKREGTLARDCLTKTTATETK